MEISITSLIVLAITFVAAGLLLLIVWPLLASRQSQGSGPCVTVKGGESIVTVRNAGGGDFSVIFSSGSSNDEQVIPAAPMSDKDAEEEVTILDELRDPDTPSERKAAIEKELLALGYKINRRQHSPRQKASKADSSPEGTHRPQRKQASAKPSESPDDDADDHSAPEGVDAELGEQEPQFDDFYAPSE